MMAPLLNPPQSNPPGRISQLLPTVKCSNCNKPVPFNELGDHVCIPPPPVPTLPKPSVSPAAVASLLPPHLQNRLASPTSLSPRTPSNDGRFGPIPQRMQDPSQQQRLGPSERLRINTAPSTSTPYQPRSSPLARTGPNRDDDDSFPAGKPNFGPANSSSPSLRARPPNSNDFRARANSAAGPSSSGLTSPSPPTTARPSTSFQDPHPQYNPSRFPPPHDTPQHGSRSSPAPPISERDIDTKSGGEAGMAGVGRRGFAAAARAAMFATPMDRSLGSQPRRVHAHAPYLNTDVPPYPNESPLSAGSGQSLHSPGKSPYPQSPVGQQTMSSSPDWSNLQTSFQPSHPTTPSVDKSGLPSSPNPLRTPFDRSRNQAPVATIPQNTSSLPTNDTVEARTPLTAKQPPFPTRPRDSESAMSVSSYSQSAVSRSISTSSSSASGQDPSQHKRPPSPPSDSGSEYGGLAYANSTDNEEDLPADIKNLKGKANPPPPLRLTPSILRSGSMSGTNHVRFPSTSSRSGPSTRLQAHALGHKRDASTSSFSSVSSGTGEARQSNSVAIAQALGLSQASPSSYGRLGGPGVGIGGRSAGGSSNSSGSRSSHSRGGPVTSGSSAGVLEREVKTLLEGANPVVDERRFGLTKSKSVGKRTFGVVGDNDESGNSNKGIKAPLSAMPASTSTSNIGSDSQTNGPPMPSGHSKTNSEESVRPVKEKKERVKKPRICLKCEHKITDGRWVQVDNGGVLCENCWKNMYLPKCRRCNLPIEKQAVSSADGQLKGKYHRECFNCHICHASFPDKSFYVFDGKPLCAYHYHEANDSLCAAARCGQPIEGPCAVSHTGDRYHPEHMTCEYPGNKACEQKLEEYWEVDGRMLCEQHAQASKVGSDNEDGEEEWVQSSRALKRVTRYIDLAGSGGGSGLR